MWRRQRDERRNYYDNNSDRLPLEQERLAMPRGRPPLEKPGNCAVSVRNVDGLTCIALTDLARLRKVSQAMILQQAIRDYVFALAAAGDDAAIRIKTRVYERKPSNRSLEELQAILERHVADNFAQPQRIHQNKVSGDN
jgi:hypothetical protein